MKEKLFSRLATPILLQFVFEVCAQSRFLGSHVTKLSLELCRQRRAGIRDPRHVRISFFVSHNCFSLSSSFFPISFLRTGRNCGCWHFSLLLIPALITEKDWLAQFSLLSLWPIGGVLWLAQLVTRCLTLG